MGKDYIVTVGREFGSQGRPIAKRAAELLGINYYDRDIVEEVAKRMKQPLDLISDKEESAGTMAMRWLHPLGQGTDELQDRIFRIQSSVISDFADQGPCIMVGRCADDILRNRKNLLRVYIYANQEAKTRFCMHDLMMSEEEAVRMCVKIDKARRNYHLKYAGYAPDDKAHVDLMINSASFGAEECAQMLAKMIKERFGN